MQIQLSPSVLLTDERSESRSGIPVCVNRLDDSVAYGPADIARFYSSFGLQPIAFTVARLANMTTLTDEEHEAVKRFLGQWLLGAQLV